MIGIDVRADLTAARRALFTLKGQAEAAAGKSLGRVATTVRKHAADTIADELNLRKGPLKARISKIRKARLTLVVQAVGGPVPLFDYQARQTKKGVTFKVKRGAKRKLYKRQGRAGFIYSPYANKKRFGNVFVRIEDNPPGKAKARIKKVWGPGVTHYFRRGRMLAAMRTLAAERWRIEFDREVGYRAQRAGITLR